MGQLQQVLTTIGQQLSRLTATQRLLIASLVVVLVMTLFVVSQYAGGREMVELLPGQSAQDQQRAIQFLQTHNIQHRIENGVAMVPTESRYVALAQMSEDGAMPDETVVLFNNLLEKTSWTMSSAQSRQLRAIALQNELARVISGFRGVRSAAVFVDSPQRTGLGSAVRTPTATVTVTSRGAEPLSQSTVDAVAALVAGANAGLSVSAVRVIDATNNQQRRARSEEDADAGIYFEHASRVEKSVRGKLLEMLHYIEGVVVTVNAQVDVTRNVTERRSVLNAGAGTVTAPVSESSMERVQQGASGAGEGGVRSNTGLDIVQANAGGSSLSDTTTESKLQTQFGQETVRTVDPRGVPLKINATINVPRTYFVNQWRALQGPDSDAEAAPDEQALAAIVQGESKRIESDVQPIVETTALVGGSQGLVTVSMIPDVGEQTRGAGGVSSGGAQFVAGGGGGGGLLASGTIKTVALGALVLVALLVMARGFKKASKPLELPSAQELAGAPPSLGLDTDMVGEADEADAALAGVEMSDDDLQQRKMLEQVSTLVHEKPSETAQLLNRWIQTPH